MPRRVTGHPLRADISGLADAISITLMHNNWLVLTALLNSHDAHEG